MYVAGRAPAAGWWSGRIDFMILLARHGRWPLPDRLTTPGCEFGLPPDRRLVDDGTGAGDLDLPVRPVEDQAAST